MSDELSRRAVMAALAAGAAFAATKVASAQQEGGAPAQQESGLAEATPAAPLGDPTTKYPKPPFARQEQAWPGLASRMEPRPDHGETSYRGSGRLQGRKALITGGDSGMGRAAAIAYAREGADVAINYLPAEESDAIEVIKLIRAAGRKAVALPGDIRTEGFCRRLVDGAARELGGLDILVSNAAYQQACESITDLTNEQFDQTYKTNVYAPFWIIKAAMAHLRPGSSIILTTSVVAYDPLEFLLDYSPTKAATLNFTKALAKQLGPKGIRVNGVAPGPIWTPFIPSSMPAKEVSEFGSQTPMKRPGQPFECGTCYVFLASSDSSYMAGQVLHANGGEVVAG